MSPVATETPTPGWGRGPTPAYTVIYTGKLHHDRGRYPIAAHASSDSQNNERDIPKGLLSQRRPPESMCPQIFKRLIGFGP